jgi:DNA-binding transcriptional ArsR family regulator
LVPQPDGSGVTAVTPATHDQLSTTFAALADPTRRAILERLLHGEASVGQLAEPFKMTTRAISKHIGVLEAAGLVTRSRDAQRRPSRIRAEPLAAIDVWLERYRRLWHRRFRRLEERLATLQKKRSARGTQR